MAVRVNYLPRVVSAQIVCIDIPSHVVNRITSICRAADSDAIIQGNEIILNWGNALIALPQIAKSARPLQFRN